MTQPSHSAQKHTEYNLPRNEPVELARLEEQARGLIQLMNGKIVHAPLHNPKKLLDVGCGTGIVCRQFAKQFPSATIYGVDISPVPAISEKPENVEYVIGDIKQLADANDEPIKEGAIDYIYQRLLICGMTDWPGYVRQMTKLLRSDGYMEIHDYAEIMYQCSSYPQDGDEIISTDDKWLLAQRRGAAQLGLDLDIGPHAEQYMKDAGLVDVQVTKYAAPFGSWLAGDRPETKLIGEHNAKHLGRLFAESSLPSITRGLGIDEEEMRMLQEDCRQSLAGGQGKYWIFYVTTGRKATRAVIAPGVEKLQALRNDTSILSSPRLGHVRKISCSKSLPYLGGRDYPLLPLLENFQHDMKTRLPFARASLRMSFSACLPRRTFASTITRRAPNRVYDPIRYEHDFNSLTLLSASSRQPLITLWTASWCPSCRVVLPLVREAIDNGVGEQHGGVGFAEVHVDAPDIGNLGMKYFVNSMPTLLSFSRQEPQTQTMVTKVEEMKDKEFLRLWIEDEARRGGAGGAGGGGGLFGGLFGINKGQ